MTTMSTPQRTEAKPKHAMSLKARISEKTNGNFTFGACVGIAGYMVLSVAWNLAEAFIK